MKKLASITGLFLTMFMLGDVFSSANAAPIGSQYCQMPAFITQPAEPNALFVVDLSGSMGWKAYDFGGAVYDANTVYEGYFTPSKYYRTDVSGIYEETTYSGAPCTTTCATWRCRNNLWSGGDCSWQAYGCSNYGCCTSYTSTGDCNVNSGNYLNFLHMARIDLLRWAITGGTPSSCPNAAKNTNGQYDSGQCDPELWNQPGNATKVGSVCNNSLDINGDGIADGGCILIANDGTKVKVPWSRVNDGLAFKLSQLALKPRMGVISYQDSGVLADKVYVGDFLAPNSTSTSFPYMNFITHINAPLVSGATPTAPAMWDALNYFAQNSPQYGGFTEQTGTGNNWRNPIFVCDGGGSNCEQIPCGNNFVVLMSDGQWNRGNLPVTGACSIDDGYEDKSADPVVPAYKMHSGFTNAPTGVSQKISAVYTVGLFLGGTGEQSLKNVAMYGSFENAAQTWPGNLTGYPNDTCTMDDCGSGKGSACEPLPTSSADWDGNGDNTPDTFFKATNALEIREKITDVILDILRRASSGTAASILASSEGSGANLVQAIFYPKRAFEQDEVNWIGTLRNFWFYFDLFNPQLSFIREDTVADNNLVLDQDFIVNMFFDTVEQRTRAFRWSDNNGDGSPDTQQSTVNIEDIASIWESGLRLWSTPAANRTIFTKCSINPSRCIASTGLMQFNPANFNSATLRAYLQASDANEAEAIIRYVRGEDTPFTPAITGFSPTYRQRSVTLNTTRNTWKLGDIVNSTPKIVSFTPHNLYATTYEDASYFQYTKSSAYRRRGTVFVGANDGMLHAFRLGLLQQINNATTTKAILCNDVNNNGQCDVGETSAANMAELGKEQWAYIPENALPYLKYLTDPDYCHLYFVDMPVYVFDASIDIDTAAFGQIPACSNTSYTNYWDCVKSANSWRTILIGGMRLGGACKDTSYSGDFGVNVPAANKGYSSYFALDITDPSNPVLLWEFSNPNLGFSTSGPAVVKIKSRTVQSGSSNAATGTNGKWFVVFASGPTGPIDTAAQQFKGFSDQNLRLFVLDLKTGSLLRTIDTGIQNAFGGSLSNASMDYNLDYQDDAIYLGYTQSEVTNPTSTTKWTQGGVIRLITREKLSGSDISVSGNTALNPNNWLWSYVAKDIGPVTSAIAKLAYYPSYSKIPKEGYLYFGTGRYFYSTPGQVDDSLSQRRIFGIKEPCLNRILAIDDLTDPVCNGTLLSCNSTLGDLATSDLSGSPQCITEASTGSGTNDPDGWYINLDPSSGTLFAERNITDPLAVGYFGTVFFTTFIPSRDVCEFGGSTALWAVDWKTGGSVSLTGKALLQVSTGAILELDLGTVFSLRDNRKTAAMKGVPPYGSGLSLIVPPKPSKIILDIRKK